MKKLFLLLLTVSSLQAQQKQNTKAGAEELIPSLQKFMELPEETRKEFGEHYYKASQLLQEKRIFEALSSVDKADKIFMDHVYNLTLKGSCYVEMRDFEKARMAFEKIEELDPKNVANRFNIAEMHYVANDWQIALDMFSKLLAEEGDKVQNMIHITEFKILICKTKLKLQDEVTILSQKYSEKDDNPYYYYAQALLQYVKGNTIEAEAWTARAIRIFQSPSILYAWQDSLEEAGYLTATVAKTAKDGE
jgi:tetratricopeptide (TPR) repeat protein